MKVIITLTDKQDDYLDVDIAATGLDTEPQQFSMAYLIGSGVMQTLPKTVAEMKTRLVNNYLETYGNPEQMPH